MIAKELEIALENMIATMDVPDDRYRRMKAKTDLQGRAIRNMTIELVLRRRRTRPSSQRSASRASGGPGMSVNPGVALGARRGLNSKSAAETPPSVVR